MKRIICVILIMCTIFLLMSCNSNNLSPEVPQNGQPETETPIAPDESLENEAEDVEISEVPNESDNWRIAIVINEVSGNEEEFRTAEAMQRIFGEDRIVHKVWPMMFAQEGEMMISLMQEIAADPEIRAVIINQAVINTNAAVDALLAIRDDMFIVYASAAENAQKVAVRASVVLDLNNPMRGEAIVMQALEMGAENIVHISFPRHMGVPILALRRDNMRIAAEREGINFVEIFAPDPMGDGGVPATQLYINQEIPRQVEMHGQNTAFFATNCAMMVPLISQVMETGAMFIDPCCPSPYHGYPTAMRLDAFVPSGEVTVNDEEIMRMVTLPELIDLARAAVAEADMTGRISAVPVAQSMLMTAMGTKYAIRWINGEVDKDIIDLDVLAEIGREFILEETGEDAGVMLEILSIDGHVYPNFILTVMDYIVL